MNSKHNKISPSASQHKLSHYYYQPLSPFNKISTPHRTRVNTSTPSIHTSPINFTTALNYCKSPNDKENAANLLNQSPMYKCKNLVWISSTWTIVNIQMIRITVQLWWWAREGQRLLIMPIINLKTLSPISNTYKIKKPSNIILNKVSCR
jgi:hypothetical protein